MKNLPTKCSWIFSISTGVRQIPNLPCNTMEDLSALSMKSTSGVTQESLSAIYSAHTAFIGSKNNEKICRALLKNVRAISETTYATGDLVYYKREDGNEWRDQEYL